jgi:hypothetical protein
LLPTLSHLSVRTGPARRFRHRRSLRYLRISPLHRRFHAPLPTSRVLVCQAIPRLSRGLSQSTLYSAYMRFKPSDSEQRSHPPYYRGCWHGVSRCFLWGWSLSSEPLTAVYIPRDFILHAASLRQTCVHCGIFVAAATRRCPGSVSVPMCRVMLSHPIPV